MRPLAPPSPSAAQHRATVALSHHASSVAHTWVESLGWERRASEDANSREQGGEPEHENWCAGASASASAARRGGARAPSGGGGGAARAALPFATACRAPGVLCGACHDRQGVGPGTSQNPSLARSHQQHTHSPA